MTDEIMETGGGDALDAALDASFDRAFAKQEGTEAPAVQEVAPEVGNIPHPKVEPEAPEAEDQDVENPDGAPAMSLAEASLWCKRVGLPAHLLKAKSEDEIIALGLEASTVKRQDDREFSQRQNREPEGQQTDSAPDDALAEGGTKAEGEAGNPDEAGDEQFTALVDELGEEAARPIIERLQAASKMQAKLEALEQERQLAPVLEAVNKSLDGLGDQFPDLSNSESRDKVIEAADKLGAAFAEKYGALPEEQRLDAVMRDAAVQVLGEPKPKTPARRRTAYPPAATSNDVPAPRPGSLDETLDAGFARAWEKQHGRA